MVNQLDDNREFKDSALGMIPKDWISCNLKDVINNIVGGGTPSRSRSDYWFGDIPWASVKDFKDDVQVLYQTEEYITKNGLINSASNIIEAGIPLICTRMAVGRAVIAVVPVAINQDLKALYPSDKINSTYLLVLLNFYRQKLASLAIGSTVKGIRIDELLSLHINVPPIPQQQQITRILDTVDKAIAQTETLIAKYKRVKTGLMQDLLTRGIDENGQLRDPKTHKFKRSPLGMIPDEWNIVTLDTLCNKITDGSHQSVKTSDHGVPFLYVSCIRDGKILWEETSKISEETYTLISKGREPLPGLILYTAVGSYGHAALVRDDKKFSFQRHIAYILPDPKKINSEYLTFWLNTNQSKQYADQVAIGNAQKTVTLGEITKFPILVPKIKEQNYIVEIITKIDKYLTHEENYKKKLQVQKTGLMQDLLTGKTSVKPLLTNQP
ncbi:restriction endonuclease subunit S [Nostoc sp. JL33]|uniref:restriction endonuclease subunit S n=1 Tax=Nostoc sp. JL33 TaxID=2815396 RepID=UPI0025DF95C5|nr:restriction endonuclease subunit S [Nostoc sp. JL33]MBN3873427.1 restriction endonuclease subunit S [Nostoc sp. JL33]